MNQADVCDLPQMRVYVHRPQWCSRITRVASANFLSRAGPRNRLRDIVSDGDAKCIRVSFLHDGRGVSVARAAVCSSEQMHDGMRNFFTEWWTNESSPSSKKRSARMPHLVCERACGHACCPFVWAVSACADILFDYRREYILELVAQVPSYRDSVPDLTEATAEPFYEATRAIGGCETIAPSAWNIRNLHGY